MYRLLLTLILFPGIAQAQESPLPTAELSVLLREMLLGSLPDPLLEQKFNWDHQEKVVVGVRWEKRGLLLRPEPLHKMHNDGVWRKIRLDAMNPKENLRLSVTDPKTVEPGKLTFTLNLEMPVRLEFEQQLWKAGIRLYSGETRARCRMGLVLKCEMTFRADFPKGSFLPDYVFRLRVTEARLGYDQFVVEHTAGVGGEAAKMLGNAVHDTISQWKPSLEANLLQKANQSIVKAGDTKEVRLKLSKLLGGK